MRQTYFLLAIVHLIFANANADIVPASKCGDRKFNVTEVSIQQLLLSRTWNVIYITDTPALNAIDHATIRHSVKFLKQPGLVTYVNIVKNDSKVLDYNCALTVGPGNEYFLHKCSDNMGNTGILRYYILKFVKYRAAYAYRCIESGVPDNYKYIDDDIRLIATVGKNTLTEDEKGAIMKLDKYLFSGSLRKLPWLLS